ncbi:cysteine desulfurase family protein [Ruminococcus gauvreauii]|uniref:cysteine desulfurase n=1 Tax=Ruminococcus gauvreauii TaxID=438033 RepID=A0ABY5VEJ4_9FIRM|nr:cysteine desulfurase family protein [Ruminococcus gauvreauii]UWP58804.1 cysteine desulfurase [Ruminococcus gauvreauii]
MIYADYAATTPVHPEVVKTMEKYYTEQFFNPSSIYPEAKAVASRLEECREQIARYMKAEAEEIIFTSGGTESDNLAIKGVMLHPSNEKKHMVTSVTEHHAVLESCRFLEKMGYEITYLTVDSHGRVSPDALENAMRPDTCLVSVMWVNNETGTLQDIKELARAAHAHGALFHTDAVQAMAALPVNVKESGVDLLSFSAHKFYGPKGCGGLYCKKGIRLISVNSGGQQEEFQRGGTENVPAILGMGKAFEILNKNLEKDILHMERLKETLLKEFEDRADVIINSLPAYSVPSICNLGFRNMEAEAIIFYLSREGILTSMGAACNTKSIEPSYVLREMGIAPSFERGCIRISLSSQMTDKEMETICEKVKSIIKKLTEKQG